jgi:hypothetical protein
MLVLPYLAGVLVAGFRWPDIPLLGAWIAGYLLSYYALQAVKTRRPARFREQLLLYGVITAPLAALVVAARPEVLWYAPAYAVLLGVNTWYAWRRQERALLNDSASVAQSCLMVFVTATIAGVPPGGVLVGFLAVLGYFTGTVCYVKTMIRERGSVTYRRASVAYHAVALGVVTWAIASGWSDVTWAAASGWSDVTWAAASGWSDVTWAAASGWSGITGGVLLIVVFSWLLVRAWLLPSRPLSPKQVGVIEIVNSVLVLVAVVLTS